MVDISCRQVYNENIICLYILYKYRPVTYTDNKGDSDMTDKEFKLLSRAQLIEIIYQLQLNQEKLTEENERLKAALEDKRLRLEQAGNIAEAALIMNDVFRNAQNAAEQYLAEIQTILAQTEAERQKILADAEAEAQAIVAAARKTQNEYDSAVETILREYGTSQSDNG